MTTNGKSNDVRANRQGYLGQNAEKLRGFSHWEGGIFRALSARFMDITDHPARRATGRYIWEQAQSVTALKRRLAELPRPDR